MQNVLPYSRSYIGNRGSKILSTKRLMFTELLATKSGSSDDETQHSLILWEHATEPNPRARINEKQIDSPETWIGKATKPQEKPQNSLETECRGLKFEIHSIVHDSSRLRYQIDGLNNT